MIRMLSLVIALAGIMFLFILLISTPETVSNLEESIVGEQVIIRGTVISERVFDSFYVWNLDSDVSVVCDCDTSYFGSFVEITGSVEEYEGEKQIRVLHVREL